MPCVMHHRGRNPKDGRYFSDEALLRLRDCVSDYCWLLSKGYPSKAALKLCGDRYRLSARQLAAVERSSCSQGEAEARRRKCVPSDSVRGEEILVDGFNMLITVEAALSGGVLLRCRDGTIRDIASIHGTYRCVEETRRALELVFSELMDCGASHARILLDSPVSNSGRLKSFINGQFAGISGFFDVRLEANPDKLLAASDNIVASSDSWILDRCRRWLNLTERILERTLLAAEVIEI